MSADDDNHSAVLRGHVWKFGDWISGDNGVLRFSEIRDFAEDHDPAELAKMCFAGIEPDFSERVQPGDIVVGGRGFGIPSHPPVPLSLLACGVSVVVVESTDSPFVRRSLNVGLPVLTCPGISSFVSAGDELEVDLASGAIRRGGRDDQLTAVGLAPMMLDIWRSGGLIPYLTREFAHAE